MKKTLLFCVAALLFALQYSPKLHWRLKGKQKWNEVPLKTAENSTHFSATIPTKVTHGTIEYYISAASTSGRRETMPRTAPAGFYSVER